MYLTNTKFLMVKYSDLQAKISSSKLYRRLQAIYLCQSAFRLNVYKCEMTQFFSYHRIFCTTKYKIRIKLQQNPLNSMQNLIQYIMSKFRVQVK